MYSYYHAPMLIRHLWHIIFSKFKLIYFSFFYLPLLKIFSDIVCPSIICP